MYSGSSRKHTPGGIPGVSAADVNTFPKVALESIFLISSDVFWLIAVDACLFVWLLGYFENDGGNAAASISYVNLNCNTN